MTTKNTKSVTLYLSDNVLDGIQHFAELTERSRSQAASYLIRMGLEQFVETARTAPKDASTATPKKARGGRKPSATSTIDPDEPKRTVRKPAAKKPAAVKKPAAKKPATRARKPRAKRAA